MLVIISDLHLTDGSSGASIPSGAFALFAERLRDLASAASWRSDGEYRPIETIDVVLLGDVLDLIRSAQWLQSGIRPWSHADDPAFAETVQNIATEVLRQNSEGVEILRNLSAGINVPPVNRWGQAVPDAVGNRAAVRLFYMVGNHDWFLHLPGAAMDAVRQMISQQLGLSNPPGMPFAHDASQCDPIAETLRRHRVLARHGDIYDPINFSGDRNSSSLGDAIVVELINRFVVEVNKRLGDQLPAATLLGIAEIDNIRPTILVPVWIDGLLERTCPLPGTRKLVKQIWDELVDQFLQIGFVREHSSWNPLTDVDRLERALKFSKKLSIGWTSTIVEWLQQLRGAAEPSYYKHALAEADFRNRRARHVVYGHTHAAESIPLDASYADGNLLNQVYFNSGTWRRVHRPTQLSAAQHEFIPHDSMTFLAFYQGDERQGRAFETWTGMLGLAAPQITVHRIDAPVASAVPAPTRRSSSNTATPQFGNQAARPLIVPHRRG